jgi:hypothetical protein
MTLLRQFQEVNDVDLTGCGHFSGLMALHVRPPALMESGNRFHSSGRIGCPGSTSKSPGYNALLVHITHILTSTVLIWNESCRGTVLDT